MKHMVSACLILLIAAAFPLNLFAGAQGIKGLSNGQTIYVPVYSHIYSGNNELPYLLAVTLSIRNTDPSHAIEIMTVDYYETQGKLLKKFITSPLKIPALGTTRFTIPEKDKTGGSGANFIVRWEADRPVNPPLVETIMIGPRTSFTSRGQAIIPSD